MIEHRGGTLIDVTRPIQPGIPVWPGDPPFQLTQRREEGFVLSSFSTTCHVGTHLDAPPGLYELMALPMLLAGAEAAPVRAVLKPLGSAADSTYGGTADSADGRR